MGLFDYEGKGAIMSSCNTYRYTLSRIWDEEKYVVNFIGLNPSTADAMNDDPTIRRCVRFAKDWGYGGIVVTNLFAFRATDPKDMMNANNLIGPDNDRWICETAEEAGRVIVAWGSNGGHLNRDSKVMAALSSEKPECLGLTKHGYPRHPLYVKADTESRLYVMRGDK